MKLAALLDESRIRVGFDTIDVTGLTLDSRKVEPGFVFAALPGVSVHGRQFAAKAVASGAVAVLSDAKIDDVNVPVIVDADPAALLARMAKRFHGGQPEHVVAITGTNGKSSTVDFLRQIWEAAGIEGASLGTLGVARKGETVTTGYTTPDSVALHQALHRLKAEGVTHLAMEASSHGLKQRRMEAVDLSIGAFTNLTQDHLDYHPDFEDYFASKARLFTERLPVGAPAIINVDTPWGEQMAELAAGRGLDVVTVGWRGGDLQICEVVPRPASQDIVVKWAGRERAIEVPFVGEFQVLNAVQAAAIALTEGLDADLVFSALAGLEGVPGRLEKVGETRDKAPVLVDYAHTPDGLDKLLRAARPHTRGRVIIVFGCGGDRDPTKRRPMGEIAAAEADLVVVTDDNPRSENPAAIRAQIMQGCPLATEIADREAAIRHGVSLLQDGDCLLVAGKGHETGQTIAGTVQPFDDRDVSRRALSDRENAHV